MLVDGTRIENTLFLSRGRAFTNYSYVCRNLVNIPPPLNGMDGKQNVPAFVVKGIVYWEQVYFVDVRLLRSQLTNAFVRSCNCCHRRRRSSCSSIVAHNSRFHLIIGTARIRNNNILEDTHNDRTTRPTYTRTIYNRNEWETFGSSNHERGYIQLSIMVEFPSSKSVLSYIHVRLELPLVVGGISYIFRSRIVARRSNRITLINADRYDLSQNYNKYWEPGTCKEILISSGLYCSKALINQEGIR